MLSLNFIKFYALLALILLTAPACRFWQTSGTGTPAPTTFSADELKSETPFSTKEPDNFQAEIVVTANAVESRSLTAKNGANRRYDYRYGEKNQLTVLQTDKNYLVLPAKKIYAEDSPQSTISAPDDWQDFLSKEWLNAKTPAKFEKLETIDNITKYRVVPGENADSEIFVYSDEKLGMPVKQEFYSTNGEQKTLNFTVEIKNLKLQTDDNLFAIPADFKKIQIEDLRKELSEMK